MFCHGSQPAPQSFAGGPLSDANGDRLAEAGVKLFSIYGGTEFGGPSQVFDTDDSQGPDGDCKTSRDWAWMKFSETMNPRMISQGDGTYELHLLVSDVRYARTWALADSKF